MKLNKKIWNGVEHPFTFQESQDPTTGVKKYIMRGMMMPKGQISRNGVLYNWESVNDKHKLLVGKPVMYNHHVDGANDKSYGHYTDSLIIENEDSIPGGWDKYYNGPGWYYEADLDPGEKDMIRKLDRGDVRHVSIQLIGSDVYEKFSEDVGDYQEAIVGDIVEGSIVPSPGFLDTTCAVMAEAFGKILKEDVTTTTGDGAIQPKKLLKKDGTGPRGRTDECPLTKKKEALSPCQKWLKSLDEAPSDNELHDWVEKQGLDVHKVEAEIYKLAKAHVDAGHAESFGEVITPIAEDDADPKELAMGIKVEMEHTDNKDEAKLIALQHLAEVKDYYTKLKQVEKEFLDLGINRLNEILKDY